jgi:hypothetical protein
MNAAPPGQLFCCPSLNRPRVGLNGIARKLLPNSLLLAS